MNMPPARTAEPISSKRRRWRMLLSVMGLLLVTAFAAVGLLQTRQYELLNATARYQDDYLVWSLFQFEVEYLKLRVSLEQAVGPALAVDADQVEQRYEIFVSRLNLIESEHAAKILHSHPDYRRTLERSKSFVQWADALPLKAELVRQHPERLREALARMDGLADAIHDLSLTASHHVAQQVTERHAMVRHQARISIWLTLLQGALTLGFAAIVIRQFRRLDRYSREQKAQAQSLHEARREAEAGSRAKSAFLANMSHELRTPMHGLLGMLALLKDTPLQPAQQAQLQAANDSSLHLLAVLNDILDVSKMEAGGISIHAEPVQLSRLLHELEELSWPQARAKQLDLRLRMDEGLPAWVSADPTRLRQILLNLLSNAIKFSEHGRVDLHLSRQTDALGQLLLRFEVSDAGIGMDAATLAKLFQRFSQGDATSSRRFGGAGLGLEISRNLARAMGGDIFVASELGRGSVFTLELRLPECAAPALAAHTATPLTSPSEHSGAQPLRILVSEDNLTNRVFLQAVLKKLGHHAVFCENGLEALQRLKIEDFDLVLMDLHTPMMDGYQATGAMRALPAPKCGIKIIALSADAFHESRQRALQAGMDDFLAKPVGIDVLTRALDRHALSLAPRAPAPAAAQLDEKTVAELRGMLGDATVRQLYTTFVAGLSKTRESLHQALRLRDGAALQAAAHSVKGAAANLGLLLVVSAADALEQSGREAGKAGQQEWPQQAAQTAALLAALSRSELLCSEQGLL